MDKLVYLNIQVCYAVGPIAQSVEQRTFNPWVDGSSPSGPTHLAHEMRSESNAKVSPVTLRRNPRCMKKL